MTYLLGSEIGLYFRFDIFLHFKNAAILVTSLHVRTIKWQCCMVFNSHGNNQELFQYNDLVAATVMVGRRTEFAGRIEDG